MGFVGAALRKGAPGARFSALCPFGHGASRAGVLHPLCPAVRSCRQPSTPMRESFDFQGAPYRGAKRMNTLAALFLTVPLQGRRAGLPVSAPLFSTAATAGRAASSLCGRYRNGCALRCAFPNWWQAGQSPFGDVGTARRRARCDSMSGLPP